MKKFKPKSIMIVRAEGPCALCGEKKYFDNVQDANDWLMSQGSTFPKGGGYDKHDFQIVFEDDDTYDGRLDCKHPSENDPDLDVAKHVMDYMKFLANLRRPAWMSDSQWEENKRYNEEHGADEARKWLEMYEVA